jgi:hypothetical protein
MKTFSVLTVSKRHGWHELAKKCIDRQTVQPEQWVIIQEGENAPSTNNPSNLNASLNEGLRHITSDYVIFYQDFIELQEDCFEKLIELADDRTFVTTCTPNYDGSDDGRYLGVDQPRPCLPEEWETNVAISPMAILRDIGGFDERLDAGWSWDNVSVAQRAAMLGARFILDESNRPRLLPHEQTSKLKMELNGERNERFIRDIREGRAPIKLPYL